MRSSLFADSLEIAQGGHFVLQNPQMLRVTLGRDVLSRQGAMVAYQGQVDFDYEGAGFSKFFKKAFTGEGIQLMRCSGQGQLFLADSAKHIHVVELDSSVGLSLSSQHVLAFDSALTWDIKRVEGVRMFSGQGMYNMFFSGSGAVALATSGRPVVLDATEAPTFVDANALVAWSSGLTVNVKSTIKMKSIIGRGSGEAMQLGFSGNGFVVVQPDETILNTDISKP